ncbi:esterase/lipase family protein [Rubrivirga sp. IMCC45206]|uniref:esterase/lipase family protein n=1 Tax=Rubrivirga sp. IMCC45206 TaxID=3391614 RepID=UPI00398F96FB
MPDPVLLIHGLGRTGLSMLPMARALRRAGFSPEVVDYPSRQHSVDELVARVVTPQVEGRRKDERVHFVTHSLGGVLVRAYAAQRADAGRPLDGSRAVMLAPPHAGSEVADKLGHRRPFKLALGPTLNELGTGDAGPSRLGPIRGIEAGVIAGTRSIVPFGRWFGGPHDGLVSVASAHAPDGIADRAVVSKTHALMMMSPTVIALTVRFLQTGSFAASGDA